MKIASSLKGRQHKESAKINMRKPKSKKRVTPDSYWEQFRKDFEAADKTKRGYVNDLATKFGITRQTVRRIFKKLV